MEVEVQVSATAVQIQLCTGSNQTTCTVPTFKISMQQPSVHKIIIYHRLEKNRACSITVHSTVVVRSKFPFTIYLARS